MPAHYFANWQVFLKDSTEEIIGNLSQSNANSGFYQQFNTQTRSWSIQIDILKSALTSCGLSSSALNPYVLFEYPIPRRGKRVDTIILLGDLILVLEFKIGASSFTRADRIQVEDYSLDLRDFHKLSANSRIIPILVVAESASPPNTELNFHFQVSGVWTTDGKRLNKVLERVIEISSSDLDGLIDPVARKYSGYETTPTIIESARALYAGQPVSRKSRNQPGD